jgi:carbonic anhydrase
MSVIPEFLAANARYAATFDQGQLPMPPARKVAVLTCMDARLDPAKALGLAEGDAHVIRNAGGRASDDAVRSLIISEQLLGTREIVVIHHTDCGMLTFSNDSLREKVRADLGVDTGEFRFLPFSDVEESVWADVEFLQDSPLIAPGTEIRGFVYDVRTGRLSAVEVHAGSATAAR